MKITLVTVSTLNSKTTRGNDPNIYSWTSKEDSRYFFGLIKKNNLIVMGSQTYKASRKVIKLSEDKLRVILTKNPKKYWRERQNNILEFLNHSPKQLVVEMEKRGYKKMLLVSGAYVATDFLKLGLINEIFLTIEPLIFGSGKNLFEEAADLNIKLKLVSVKKLNKQGTLLLKYTCEK